MDIKATATKIAKQIRAEGYTADDADGMVTELVEMEARTADEFDRLADAVWKLLEKAA